MKIINKQWVVAIVLLLLIPVVLVLSGTVFSFINPEIAAGHPNYVRNFHLLSLLKITVMWTTAACVLVLWLLVCLQVIRAKKRSPAWLLLAALGLIVLHVGWFLLDRLFPGSSVHPNLIDWGRDPRAGAHQILNSGVWDLIQSRGSQLAEPAKLLAVPLDSLFVRGQGAGWFLHALLATLCSLVDTPRRRR